MSTLHEGNVIKPDEFSADEAFARRLDETDPLRGCREQFECPAGPDGRPALYLCGNSLGLMPKAARAIVDEELDKWARRGVEGHHRADTPWYTYHETVRDTGARLVGARPGEVVFMNSLTVNLHLMMVSFFAPTPERRRILIDWPAFPSDLYAVKTHLATRGIDPDDALVTVRPRPGEHTVRTEDIEALLEAEGSSIAMVLMNGVNYYTGQFLDLERITRAAHARGVVAGFDLAHAAGNVAMCLHDWGVDFACWCSYKYLNGGPGAVAGCFIHERHATDVDRLRFGGWWGNDPATRFAMHLQEQFVPRADADGWQLSNPPILAMAPLRASLALFDEVGMPALREKSVRLTGYLHQLIEHFAPDDVEIITPHEPERRGCQLSLLLRHGARERFAVLERAGVVCDYREPNVVRIAPVPLYNTYADVWRFVEILTRDVR